MIAMSSVIGLIAHSHSHTLADMAAYPLSNSQALNLLTSPIIGRAPEFLVPNMSNQLYRFFVPRIWTIDGQDRFEAIYDAVDVAKDSPGFVQIQCCDGSGHLRIRHFRRATSDDELR